jgi:pimeloyl-ACP methyl ester carboxylesterase
MCAALARAELVVVPDAGHTVHLEHPQVAGVLSTWLATR